MPRYVALLRAISNVSMAPFRAAMEELGFTDIKSFGMSGNLAFTAPRTAVATMEARITERMNRMARINTLAIVRTLAEVQKVAAGDPFASKAGAAILFLAAAPSADHKKALTDLDVRDPLPILKGEELYFIHPVTLVGKKGSLDFEKILGVKGTARSSRIVARLAEEAVASD